jgi:hypothetical protein
LLKNSSRQPTGLNWSDRFGKPVRPVLVWTVGRNSTRGKNSNLHPIDLPIHSTDQSETLGIDGVPRGLPLARNSVPKTHSIKGNRKSTLKDTSNPRTHTNFPHQITKSKVPKTHQENHQERAPKITTKNNREQHNEALRNHAESSIHTKEIHTRSSLSPDHPTLSQDLTMNLSS